MANAKVQLNRLIAVHYQHPNLNAIDRFLVDFGLVAVQREETRTYYRGFGPETYVYIAEKSLDDRKHFVGGILAVESVDDLHRAARVAGASSIEDSNSLGGGQQVVLTDPVGMKVTLVHGAKTRSAAEVNEKAPAPIILNSGTVKARQTLHAFERGPCQLAKCGHYGLRVDSSKFDEAVSWYMDIFNLKLSSCLQLADGKPAFMFLHIDKGKEFVDHHTIFLSRAMKPLPKATPHHCSFESDSFDTQQLGHDWLLQTGWTSCYGIGRHKYGSHIFDYWFDASGNIIEHYTDGDLVNCDTPPTYEQVQPDSIKVWGPSIPLAFFTGRPEDAIKPQSNGPALTSLDHVIRDGTIPSSAQKRPLYQVETKAVSQVST
ncbi:similar to putative 2,3-dihydroxybiphenyl-1,2-dioxygenase or glyoxalase/bleomycin resistance protein [Plenodomus lingam JN3]|uniref:Similar to putative 2,3-dihydroxybiphenyl-1,2-dioxygenase or glyoxalase/bleomycin resistance protein n=1 Tax=Leptosphaeria maculans (strain JN3 / isolate v23.1.3 / race Av1-4-5-6-7-8) TaxID=985895 RepID=E5A5R6_LEPMJ|nr:similar to putative 2,3-dihydroxybiphenyl-1,2-dioxygenase or glyoxalase/bleomycin resistance protein [Plenodomus lingam JN3]CBX98964.1 similar to putative 2,3-dihydroxybiphenyl-1,2-dioxygenase or glyoxalase/bleomycin resistance protein [Plenodomus lingam JN3]